MRTPAITTVSFGIKPASAGSILGPGGGGVVQPASASTNTTLANVLTSRPRPQRRASLGGGSRYKSYGYRLLCNPFLEAHESGWGALRRPPDLEERTRRR